MNEGSLVTSRHRLASLALIFCLPGLAAADPAVLVSAGRMVSLTPELLARIPAIEASTSHLSSKGIQAARYKGVLLWDLLEAEGVIGDTVKPALRHAVVVSASDGHEVAYSVGELAPDFGNQPVMVAWEKDGAPIADGLQMVVPGDAHGARYVKGVVRLDYR